MATVCQNPVFLHFIYWILADSSHSVALWGSGSIISAFHNVKCRKNGNFYCPECCRTTTGIVANFLHFFYKLVCIFLHFNFSYKNGFAFFCIIFAFLLHPDFWGSIFQLHLFCIFLQNIFFTVFQKEAAARPHKSIVIMLRCLAFEFSLKV